MTCCQQWLSPTTTVDLYPPRGARGLVKQTVLIFHCDNHKVKKGKKVEDLRCLAGLAVNSGCAAEIAEGTADGFEEGDLVGTFTTVHGAAAEFGEFAGD